MSISLLSDSSRSYNSAMLLEKKVAVALSQRKQTLSIAESCSGGLLSHRITNVPGSSGFFLGGVVAYDNQVKIDLLKVPPKLLLQHGAVSAPVALAMARRARKIFKSDFAVAVTGIAGPGGGTKDKPVGLVFVAVSSPRLEEVNQHLFKGTRLAVKTQTTTTALKLLLKAIPG